MWTLGVEKGEGGCRVGVELMQVLTILAGDGPPCTWYLDGFQISERRPLLWELSGQCPLCHLPNFESPRRADARRLFHGIRASLAYRHPAVMVSPQVVSTALQCHHMAVLACRH
jgi:hypothetical protein